MFHENGYGRYIQVGEELMRRLCIYRERNNGVD